MEKIVIELGGDASVTYFVGLDKWAFDQPLESQGVSKDKAVNLLGLRYRWLDERVRCCRAEDYVGRRMAARDLTEFLELCAVAGIQATLLDYA